MKKNTKIVVALLVFFLFLLLLNHYMSYSMKIGNTDFYLVETMATSDNGKTLLSLCHKDINGGYKGVEMKGFPKNVLWNESYLISKNYDGNTPRIINYVIIKLDSITVSNGAISELQVLNTKTEYNNFLLQRGLSESSMKQIDNCILWWELLFK